MGQQGPRDWKDLARIAIGLDLSQAEFERLMRAANQPVTPTELLLKARQEEDEEINVVLDKKVKSKKTDKSLVDMVDELHEAKEDIPRPNKDKVFGVFVHYADCLKLDFFVLHPVIRVSLVDLSTGKFISKSDKNRKVTSYYEGSHVSNIVPLMTQP